MVAIATHEDIDLKDNVLNLSIFSNLMTPSQGYNV
jgi:hypothetical protein